MVVCQLCELSDPDFPEGHPADAEPDSDSDSDHVRGTGSDSELISDDSSSASDSGEDADVQIVWAQAGCSIWLLGHAFEDKLQKDIVDDRFVPENKKTKPVANPAAKAAPKALAACKIVQDETQDWKGLLFHSSPCP